MDRVPQCCGEAGQRSQRAVISRSENDLHRLAREDADVRHRAGGTRSGASGRSMCVAPPRSCRSIAPARIGMERIQPDAMRTVAGLSVAAVLAVAGEGALRASRKLVGRSSLVRRPAVPARPSRLPALRLEGDRCPRRIHPLCYECMVAIAWCVPRSCGAKGGS